MVSNYEIMKQRMEKEFLNYDQESIINRFDLEIDEQFLYTKLLNIDYRVNRSSGCVEWSQDKFATCHEAEYNDAMTLYDLFCYSSDDTKASGKFVNMKSLSTIHSTGIGTSLGQDFYTKEKSILDNKEEQLISVLENFGGTKIDRGDITYQISFFHNLDFIFQFWNSDDEFDASIELFWDANVLSYMHYETVWFANSFIINKIAEQMKEKI